MRKSFFTKAIVCAGIMASAIALSSIAVFADITDMKTTSSANTSPIEGTVYDKSSSLSQYWVYPGSNDYEDISGTCFDVEVSTSQEDKLKQNGIMFNDTSNNTSYSHGIYLKGATDTVTISVKNTGTLILDYSGDGNNRYASIDYNNVSYDTGKTGANGSGIQTYFDIPESGTYTIKAGDKPVYFYAIGFIQKNVAKTYTVTWDLSTKDAGLVNYQGASAVEALLPNNDYEEDIKVTATADKSKLQSRDSNNDTQYNSGAELYIPVYSTDDKVVMTFRSSTTAVTVGDTKSNGTEVEHTATAAEVENGYVKVTTTGTAYVQTIKLITTNEPTERTSPEFEFVETVVYNGKTYIVGKVTDTTVDSVGFGASSRAKANAYNNITKVNFESDTVYENVIIGDKTYTSTDGEYYVAFELIDEATGKLYVAPYTVTGNGSLHGLGVDATPAGA